MKSTAVVELLPAARRSRSSTSASTVASRPGRRLVEDQQRRIRRERHRDHDALLHAAGELMRVALQHRVGVGDLHLAKRASERSRASARLAPRSGEDLGDLAADAERRVQRACRGSGRPSRRRRGGSDACLCRAARARRVPAIVDRAARHAAVAREVANDRERRRRLAAARLADEAVALLLADLEVDAAQDLPVAPADAVDDLEVLDRRVPRASGSGASSALIGRAPAARRRRSG